MGIAMHKSKIRNRTRRRADPEVRPDRILYSPRAPRLRVKLFLPNFAAPNELNKSPLHKAFSGNLWGSPCTIQKSEIVRGDAEVMPDEFLYSPRTPRLRVNLFSSLLTFWGKLI